MESPENGRRGAHLRKINVLDYLVVLARHRRMIVRTVAATIALMIILFWFIIPRWYKSTSTVLPPKQNASLGLLSAVSRTASSIRNFGLAPMSDDLANFQAVLDSRRCLSAVVDSFRLTEVYGSPNEEEAVKTLQSNVSVSLGKEDVSLEISAFDTDKDRAAAIANYLVSTLDRIYREMSVYEARQNRLFLEQRYGQNLVDLRSAEDSLRVFQENHGVYDVTEQVKAAVDAAATLRSQIMMREIQLAMLERSATGEKEHRSVHPI